MTGDQARVMVSVAVAPARAFELFTGEIDRWWRRGAKFRHAGAASGFVHMECGPGGRLFESFGTGAGEQVVEVGTVTVWQPPSRLVFSWRNATFAPDELTEVEVTFEPSNQGTLLTLTHRGFAALRPDHPARHGSDGPSFSRSLGLWWGEQMTSLRQVASSGPNARR